MKKFTPVSELRVTMGFRCEDLRCTCVHFVCPGCGDETSIQQHKTTPVFPALCAEEKDGDLFFVDARSLEEFPQ